MYASVEPQLCLRNSGTDYYYCAVCDSHMNNINVWRNHLDSDRHKRNVKNSLESRGITVKRHSPDGSKDSCLDPKRQNCHCSCRGDGASSSSVALQVAPQYAGFSQQLPSASGTRSSVDSIPSSSFAPEPLPGPSHAIPVPRLLVLPEPGNGALLAAPQRQPAAQYLRVPAQEPGLFPRNILRRGILRQVFWMPRGNSYRGL